MGRAICGFFIRPSIERAAEIPPVEVLNVPLGPPSKENIRKP